jgi:predicted MFS family arabinose efflux permease
VTDLTRAGLHTALAILIYSDAVTVWELAVIEAAFGAAQAFFQPAYTGLVPQTVPEELIQEARALTQSMENVAFMLGPAVATALVLGVGAGEAFALDAATFVLSAVLLTRVRPRARGEATARSASVWSELRAGFYEVRSRRWVWVTIAVFTGAVLCVYAPWYSLAPIIARHSYASAGVFGLLECVAGAGAIGGAIVGLTWRPRRPLKAGMLLVLSWPVLGMTFAAHAPLALVVVLAFVTGFGFAQLMILWETALARYIPAGSLSRVSAYDWMGSLAFLPIGYLLAGPLADALGARTVLGFGSAVGLVLLALGLAPRETRELGASAARSAEQLARDVGVEARGEA